MKIVTLIPARGGSRVIPRKNIMNFCGKPLVVWTIEQALESVHGRDVYVSTDDSEIADVARQAGAGVIMRPEDLATDTASSESALLHAISQIERSTAESVEIVIFLQATSPVRRAVDIDNAVEKLVAENADSLLSAAILEDFCVWESHGDEFRSLTFDYRNRGRRQDRKPYFLENGSIYIFRTEIIRQYHNRIGGKLAIYPMPMWMSYEIDSHDDVDLCEYYMKNKIVAQTDRQAPEGRVVLLSDPSERRDDGE